MVFMFQREFRKIANIIEKKLKEAKKVAIFYDSDADGCCSAALLIIYLLKEFKKYPDHLVSCLHDVDEKLKGVESDLVFILDTQPKKEDRENFIIIDHHLIQKVPKKSIIFNPMLLDKNAYIATSCLIYRILNKLTDLSDACWIASIGIKADKSEKTSEDILKLTYKEYPEFKKLESKLIRLTSVSKNLLDANIVVNSLIECYNIGSPSFFGKTESSSKLVKMSKRINLEFKLVMNSLKELLKTKKISFYGIYSDFNIQSLVANSLFMREPKKTIIVCNLKEDLMRAEVRSMRDGDFKKFEKKLKEIIEDIGGHKRAFGFSLKREKLDDLLKVLANF